jgi:hypothetical protein
MRLLRKDAPRARRLALVGFAVATLASGCWAELETDTVTDAGTTTPEPPSFEPSAPTMPRLTTAQYRNAIFDLFGDGILVPTALEPDISTAGFLVVGAGVNTVSPRGVEQYEAAAYEVAEQVVETPALRRRVVGCEPADTVDDDCARAALAPLARRAWRRAATEDELERLVGLAAVASETLESFDAGLSFAIAAILQSPNFIYRIELGEPDPDASGGEGDALRYSSLEMASRLAFFLWNGLPDEQLLAAAERGELTEERGLERQVRRMLASERAREGLRAFVSEWLELDRLLSLSKDPGVFVHMSSEVGPAAREETLRGFEYLAFDLDGDLRDIFTTRRTFLNRKLAAIYGVPAPSLEGFAMTELPADGPRRGLLGQLSVLALNSHPTSSSATLRGVFVRETLLCQSVPTPPAGVDTSIPEPSPELPTLRERIAVHLEDDSCSACHAFVDYIGLGLENFDGLGRFRLRESDVLIDASGELDGVLFDDAVELAEAIANHPQLPGCVVRNAYRYATHQIESDGDRPQLRELTEHFTASGYRLQELLAAIAMSEGFRRPAAPDLSEPDATGGSEGAGASEEEE